MSFGSDERGRHIAGLDGLRAIAVTSVLLFHYSLFSPNIGLFVYAKRLLWYGYAGVDLFFAISGFLITTILIEHRGTDSYFSAFYARRFLRIVPLYALVVAGAYLVRAAMPASRAVMPSSADLPYYLTFLSNWTHLFERDRDQVLQHFWSLAVEEQFYFVWPLCVALVPERRLPAFACVFGVLWTVIRIAIVANGVPSGYAGPRWNFSPDALFFGSFAAAIFPAFTIREGVRVTAWIFAICFLAVVLLTGGDSDRAVLMNDTIGFTLLGVGVAALVLCVATADRIGRVPAFLRSPALTRIGRYSYGIYVYHLPILFLYVFAIRPHLPPIFLSNVALGTSMWCVVGIVTYALAALSYECFERPILAQKRRFPYDATSYSYAVPRSKY